VRTFTAYARLDQVNQFAQSAKSIEKNLIMQNKPNLCPFCPVSGDCEEKQTQTNPIFTRRALWRANPNLPAAHATASPNAGHATQNRLLNYKILQGRR
jgi:hypothetical protein